MRTKLVVALIAALTMVATVASAAPPKDPGPLERTGELRGAPYEIRVPEDWNGTLVMYAHGYRDKADHPGEVDDRSASAFVDDPFEEVMLAAGYAIAGSAYSDNGWAVAEGIQDTRRLADYFQGRISNPDAIILVGFSMGSVIAFESIEKYPGMYDGAIPACAVGAGASRTFDATVAVASAFDAVFGWPEEWGTPGDVRDDLDFDSEVVPVLGSLLSTPEGQAGMEFIRRVAGVPIGPEWPFSTWYFTTEGRAELERRAHGPVGSNLGHTYSLSDEDRAAIGVDDATIDQWLAAMDDTRYDAPRRSERYVERYADYSGKILRPVLTLHTEVDALVPPAHIAAYHQTVKDAGRTRLLSQAWTSGIGHCAFTPDQLLTAVQAVDTWIEDRVRPEEFPAAQGFIELDPPAWPQP